ncbi:MAG TPA: hypothetical protein VGC79_02280 [Polyangiaceae bacterium]
MRLLCRRATLSLWLGFSCSLGACSSPSPAANEPAATAGASGSAVGCRPSDGDLYEAGLDKPGTRGNFVFTLVSSTPAPPALNDNRFVLQVSDANGSVMTGALSVMLDMPEHGHYGQQPEIRFDAESQAFVLEPLDLFMVGLWRFSFSFEGTVSGAPRTDSAVFEFCID